jgi:hypothetical protein
VFERKNRTLIEMAKTMLDDYKTSDQFWADAVNMMCHGTNRLYLHKLLKKSPYELLTGNKQNVSYFRVFGTKCYALQKSLLNLLLKFMKDSCLAMIQTHAHIMFSTKTPVVLKPHVTQCC